MLICLLDLVLMMVRCYLIIVGLLFRLLIWFCCCMLVSIMVGNVVVLFMLLECVIVDSYSVLLVLLLGLGKF